MKRRWFGWTVWLLFLAALLALGVYVMVNSPEWTPQRIEDVFPQVEGMLL